MISAAQRKRLFAIAKKAGWSTEQMKGVLLDRFQLTSTQSIPVEQYEAICEHFERIVPPTDLANPDESPF